MTTKEKWKKVIEIDKEVTAQALRDKVEDTTHPYKQIESDKNKTPYDKRVREKQIINK